MHSLSGLVTCGTLYVYVTALHILTGLFNTLGGAYCLKAKAVIQAQSITLATDMTAPVPGQVTAPM